MAYADETEAFRKFHQLFPEHSVLLVDTYDTLAAVDKIIQNGLHPSAIRLDSGDLLALSIQARKRLDQAGLKETKIFASGDLDEYAIRELLERGAQIDGFGVGTALATSKDAPALGGVYKLVDLESDGNISYRAKFSEEKLTYPGRKQVFRSHDSAGIFRGDTVACETEVFPGHEPLLSCVMQRGKLVCPAPDLSAIQRYARLQLERLPEGCFLGRERYNVNFSQRLEDLLTVLRRRIKHQSEGKRGSEGVA